MATRGLKQGQRKRIADRPPSVDVKGIDIRLLVEQYSKDYPLVLEPKHVKKLTGISESSLAKARMCGNLPGSSGLPPSIKIGKRARYLLPVVLAWLCDKAEQQAI